MFGSTKRASKLEQCLKGQTDVPPYKWFPEVTYSEVTGAHFYQRELSALAKKYQSTPAMIEMAREPNNQHDPKAIAYYCEGKIVGHVPSDALDWWHNLFSFIEDENARLVGVATFQLWKTTNEFLLKPQIRVPKKFQ